MKNNSYIWGLLFIVIGAGWLVSNWFGIRIFSWGNMWPLFILVPGLCFEYSFFSSRKNPGVLVPGGILTTIGLLFIFEEFTGWYFSGYTWPIYILAVAIGLFQLYYFGDRSSGTFGVSLGLGGFAIICLINNIFGRVFRWLTSSSVMPIVFIVIGLIIVGTQWSRSRKEK